MRRNRACFAAHQPCRLNPTKVPARVEGDEELLALEVDLERVRADKKCLDGLERARQEVLADPADVRVLDDEVAAQRNERRVTASSASTCAWE